MPGGFHRNLTDCIDAKVPSQGASWDILKKHRVCPAALLPNFPGAGSSQRQERTAGQSLTWQSKPFNKHGRKEMEFFPRCSSGPQFNAASALLITSALQSQAWGHKPAILRFPLPTSCDIFLAEWDLPCTLLLSGKPGWTLLSEEREQA